MSRPKPERATPELAHEFDGRQFQDEAGVDLTLVWEALERTPSERLRHLEEVVRALGELLDATVPAG